MEGIFFESTRHSSRRRAASMSRFVLLLEMVRSSVGDARLEPEVALAPDGERVDRLLARGVVELGVHDLPVVQVDLALGPVGQMEDAGLPADADELDDVREVKLSERALKGHE